MKEEKIQKDQEWLDEVQKWSQMAPNIQTNVKL